MRIGFLDSGVGGLTVLKEALKLLPGEDYIYYADTRNAPYGTKSKEEVKAIVTHAADFLLERGIKALVIACNTATSIAIDDLRKNISIPVIGMEPAVKPAVEKTANTEKRVLVAATPLTLKEEKFHNLVERVDRNNIVDYLPLPELVVYAEQYVFEGIDVEAYLRRELSAFKLEDYGTMVLGCTHFPHFRNTLKKLLPAYIEIIDGSFSTVKHLKNVLEANHLLKGTGTGEVLFINSGEAVTNNDELAKYRKVLGIAK